MTAIRFDAGRWESLAFGRLIARQIIHALDETGAFLEGWLPGETP